VIHVFLLLVFLNGERQGDDLYFKDVNDCGHYAREITISSMMARDSVTAICVPKLVKEEETTIY
jgi:hypothetical protein